MVRYATESDIGSIVRLARREHAMSPWSSKPFSDAAVADTALAFIRGQGRTALLSDGGYFFGLVQPMGFTLRYIALEYAWFAEDGSGLELLRRFEKWARNMGAAVLTVHNYTGDHRLARVMTSRYGFATTGTAMSKDLES